MPLFNCPICNGAVSQEAATCPHCGHPNPVEPSMIEARIEEEKRRVETQKRAEIQSNRQGSLPSATNQGSEASPSAFRKLLAVLAIACALISSIFHMVGIFFEFPLFDYWWEVIAIDRFLYFFITLTIPFFLAQALLLFANFKKKTKLWAGAGLFSTLCGSGFHFLNLSYFNLFHYQYVMSGGWDSSWWVEWNFDAIFWHGGDFLFLLGTALLAGACLCQKNKIFAILSLLLVLLCFVDAFERMLTFQFDDPFGRLSNGLVFLNKLLWVTDDACWMMIMILCAIGTLSQSGKSATA